MSNYHVMQVSDKKDTATVAFHITVPDENNAVSVNLRTALKQYLDGIDSSERVVSQVPWLETDFAAEFTAIQNGGVYEHLITVEFDANLTVPEKRTILDSDILPWPQTFPILSESGSSFGALIET